MLHHAALALFMGPALIMVAANGVYRLLTNEEPPIGVPVTEAYADPAWTPVQRLMRDVLETGCRRTVSREAGVLTIVPVIERERPVGVETRYLPLTLATPECVLTTEERRALLALQFRVRMGLPLRAPQPAPRADRRG